MASFLRRLFHRREWVEIEPDHPLWSKPSVQRWLASDSEVMSRKDWE